MKAADIEPRGISFHREVSALECRLIESALRKHNGIVSQAARWLGLSRKVFYDKMVRYEIDRG